MSDETLRFYDENAEAYADRTFDSDMQPELVRFRELVDEAAFVLDTGCGSGRDALHLQSLGLRVLAADASEAMAAQASEVLGAPVALFRHQEVTFQESFDGIWASATLLHVPRDAMADVFARYVRALRPGGVLFASFKAPGGRDDGPDENGRHFTYLDADEVRGLVQDIPHAEIVEVRQEADRMGRGHEWVGAFIRRTAPG